VPRARFRDSHGCIVWGKQNEESNRLRAAFKQLLNPQNNDISNFGRDLHGWEIDMVHFVNYGKAGIRSGHERGVSEVNRLQKLIKMIQRIQKGMRVNNCSGGDNLPDAEDLQERLSEARERLTDIGANQDPQNTPDEEVSAYDEGDHHISPQSQVGDTTAPGDTHNAHHTHPDQSGPMQYQPQYSDDLQSQAAPHHPQQIRQPLGAEAGAFIARPNNFEGLYTGARRNANKRAAEIDLTAEEDHGRLSKKRRAKFPEANDRQGSHTQRSIPPPASQRLPRLHPEAQKRVQRNKDFRYGSQTSTLRKNVEQQRPSSYPQHMGPMKNPIETAPAADVPPQNGGIVPGIYTNPRIGPLPLNNAIFGDVLHQNPSSAPGRRLRPEDDGLADANDARYRRPRDRLEANIIQQAFEPARRDFRELTAVRAPATDPRASYMEQHNELQHDLDMYNIHHGNEHLHLVTAGSWSGTIVEGRPGSGAGGDAAVATRR